MSQTLGTSFTIDSESVSTLNEPICDSVVKERQTQELCRAGQKLKYVVCPWGGGDAGDFRQWDLWGPLFFPICIAFLASTSYLLLPSIYLGIGLVACNAKTVGTKA